MIQKLLALFFGFILSITVEIGYSQSLGASAIASAHPLATQAGNKILDSGGNAFDAAIAIASTLAVVEPYSSGLGGGGFFLLHEANGNDIMLDARETAPARSTRTMFLDKNGDVDSALSMSGPLSAGIPGTPAALVHLAKKYGTLPLATVLGPAITHAKNGFNVTDRYRRWAKFRLSLLQRYPASARIFLYNNEVPPHGHLIKQPQLATTLEAIAKTGGDSFYRGETARQMVKAVSDAGGIWQLSDLHNYKLKERQPIIGQFGDIKITTAAPPSSGGIVLVNMLNILAGYDLEKMKPAQQKHLTIEAMRRAYRDRAIYMGDPDFVSIPTSQLLSQDYADQLRASINLNKATPSDTLPGIKIKDSSHHTTHFSIIDKLGNRVSATLTINYPFGSGMVAGNSGVLLNDEMDDFSAKPGIPNAYGLVGAEANAIEPGKRPLSSMTPTFLETDDRIAILGTPGGSRIITMVLLATLDFNAGNKPASWVGLPRYHHQYLPDMVFYEPDAISNTEAKKLTGMGHKLKKLQSPYGDAQARYGNMQAIMWNKKQNSIYAASDPRGEGSATTSKPAK